jgi:hypothetical protein
MTCKHRWEPVNGNIKPNHYLYQCTRCSQLISATLKDKT